MCIAAQAERRNGRCSEELDAGLAWHLPRLQRRHRGCLEHASRSKFTAFDQFEDEASAGEEIVESYAEKRQSFPVSPATMLRLLLLRRRPMPPEVREQPELPRNGHPRLRRYRRRLLVEHGN
jgi:hypothetical protein